MLFLCCDKGPRYILAPFTQSGFLITNIGSLFVVPLWCKLTTELSSLNGCSSHINITIVIKSRTDDEMSTKIPVQEKASTATLTPKGYFGKSVPDIWNIESERRVTVDLRNIEIITTITMTFMTIITAAGYYMRMKCQINSVAMDINMIIVITIVIIVVMINALIKVERSSIL